MRYQTIRLVALLAILTAGACACPETSDRLRFERAISDTAVYKASSVLPLTPLSYPVEAATLTNQAQWAEGREGQTITLERDAWITVEPEVKKLCQGRAADTVIPLLHKLLGLKPVVSGDDAGRFVLMTILGRQSVGPAAIGVFRPCADPDPQATSCGNSLKGPDSYARWFAQTLISSFKIDAKLSDTGYPWTRLGYTYNWDMAASSPRGVQEYVVPKGSKVLIRKIVLAQDYCR